MNIIKNDCLKITVINRVLSEVQPQSNRIINELLTTFVLMDEDDHKYISELQQE